MWKRKKRKNIKEKKIRLKRRKRNHHLKISKCFQEIKKNKVYYFSENESVFIKSYKKVDLFKSYPT